MDLELDDKIIAVTGGAGSLGTEVVRLLVEEGAQCIIPVRDMSELNEFPFKKHQQVKLVNGIDLSDENQALHFYEEVENKVGTPWASVNLAGGFGMGKIEDTSLSDFVRQMNINAYTCYNSCRGAIESMRHAGQGGRIVNITSRPGINPRRGSGLSAYASSKAAVAALTQSLASELVSEQILVNAIAPSIIDTPQNREAMPDADFEKWVDPANIGKQILFLISPQNKSTHGSLIPIYGES
jgi:NAD(P)-dependent dehydrogenase (short-subunit alcohol dehydrogenase family)